MRIFTNLPSIVNTKEQKKLSVALFSRSHASVILITDALSQMQEAEGTMKNNDAPYKIFRILRDGEELFVAGRADLREAKACVDKFLECWPGKYSIHGPESFNVICRPT